MTSTKKKRRFPLEFSSRCIVFGSFLQITLLHVCVQFLSAAGAIIETPQNATVIVNHSTSFNCSKSSNNSNELIWYHYPLDGVRQDVYDHGRIIDRFKDRFSIDRNMTSGTFNLLVRRTEISDAGRYQCAEPHDADTGPSAELTVLHADVVCESDNDLNEVVGPTTCDQPIAPDQLRLLCSVNYSGNFPPTMRWIKVGSELQSIKTECRVRAIDNKGGVRGNHIMCNATLEANLDMNGSDYICEIINAKQFTCSLKVNKIIYLFSNTSERAVTTTEEVFCSANTSVDLLCSYKWYANNHTEHIHVKLGQTLTPSNAGRYTCHAECKVRNEACAFTAMVLNASKPDSSNLYWLLVILPIIGLIVSVLAYRIWKKYYRSNPTGRNSNDRLLVERLSTENNEQVLVEEGGRQEVALESSIDAAPLVPSNDLRCHLALQEECSSRPLQSPDPATLASVKSVVDFASSVDHQIVVIASNDDIEKACKNNSYLIRKGLSGEIHGPMYYEKTKCICTIERVSCVEKEKVDTVCENSRKWMKLSHDNLIKFYDVIALEKVVYIVMENVSGESVREALQKRTSNLPIEELVNWITQVAQGMNYLHENSIVHRDLKCAQIFIVKSPDTLKIECFNLFGDDSVHDDSSAKSCNIVPPDDQFTEKSDVWCFGCVIWEMLTRTEPYTNMARQNIMDDIKKGATNLEIPKWCPKDLQGILNGCRKVEHSERPSFRGILQLLENMVNHTM